MRNRVRTIATVVALAFIAVTLGACGGDDAPSTAGTSTTTASPPPKRIVSLSPTATEMLFAIEAGPQVVAVDDQSNYPANAPKTNLSSFKPNVEAIANYDPELVVITDSSPELKAGLDRIGLRSLVLGAAKTLDDTYAQLTQLGDATGHRPAADRVVAEIRNKVATIAASVPPQAKGATYYHELDPSYFTATSKTFIGSVYSVFGLRNIADPADAQGSGYPQLSAEFIVKANPDIVFLADTKCCKESAATVAKRPGWSNIAAVRNGAVIELDDDLASRWGPRIVDFMELVAARLQAVEKAA